MPPTRTADLFNTGPLMLATATVSGSASTPLNQSGVTTPGSSARMPVPEWAKRTRPVRIVAAAWLSTWWALLVGGEGGGGGMTPLMSLMLTSGNTALTTK